MIGHADVTGDRHPNKRAYRDEMRPPPARMVERMKVWRKRIRRTMRELGRPAAVELWRGPSRFTGEPIVVIAAKMRRSGARNLNAKTNDMVQVYILPQTDPLAAIHAGDDASVCGTCIHRPRAIGDDARRDCYVNVAWAPRNLTGWWRDGRIPVAPPGLLEGAAIRFGAWGDPAAVPAEVWAPLVAGAITHTGYTQRWTELDVAAWGWLMASVVGVEQQRQAVAAGWRTFRTLYPGELEAVGERECLATASHVSCLGCGGCGGTSTPSRPNYTIRAHGFRAQRVTT